MFGQWWREMIKTTATMHSTRARGKRHTSPRMISAIRRRLLNRCEVQSTADNNDEDDEDVTFFSLEGEVNCWLRRRGEIISVCCCFYYEWVWLLPDWGRNKQKTVNSARAMLVLFIYFFSDFKLHTLCVLHTNLKYGIRYLVVFCHS